MYDRFDRRINYLRVSVTDRCNLRCVYCMPAEGIRLIPHDQVLSFEEIEEVVRTAITLGIDKVRITGGEPLVRKGVDRLVALIASLEGIRDLGLTTNGILLEEFAPRLAAAGLHRINISLDTVDPDQYRGITRGGDIGKVFAGIDAARKAGLEPVKINCVVEKSSREENAAGVREFCRKEGLEVRFIHRMDLESGCFTVVEGGSGGNCSGCNRLRLTAAGTVRPCLFDNLGYNVREWGAREALLRAIYGKPEKGTVNTLNYFNNIGG
jgi:cyclic pyranopterin phosphate synthase